MIVDDFLTKVDCPNLIPIHFQPISIISRGTSSRKYLLAAKRLSHSDDGLNRYSINNKRYRQRLLNLANLAFEQGSIKVQAISYLVPILLDPEVGLLGLGSWATEYTTWLTEGLDYDNLGLPDTLGLLPH
ncbi:hypothetical protein CLU79DRAFT_721354 [Phycomyces nitens]|nr:hypothetical protein CLU79DRAFT_721354 [Phycomyces nitens]